MARGYDEVGVERKLPLIWVGLQVGVLPHAARTQQRKEAPGGEALVSPCLPCFPWSTDESTAQPCIQICRVWTHVEGGS